MAITATTLRSCLFYAFAGAILLISAPRESRAQQNDDTEVLYTFAFVRVPLQDALDVVMRQTSLNLFYETDLVEGLVSFCSINRKPQEDVLRCVLEDTGLDFVRLSNGTYVLSREVELAAQYGSIRGFVADRLTGSPLRDANVLLVGSNLGTSTSDNGYFVFPKIISGPQQVIVTHVAYEDTIATVVVGPKIVRELEFELRPTIVVSRPIVIDGMSRKLPFEFLDSSENGQVDIRQTPGASVDITRSLSTIAGVQVTDALSTIQVQGGDAGEHEYRLDGVPVFMPLSNGGFIGPFSPFAIERITVFKAGLKASVGSVLSGVVAVDHDVSDEHTGGVLQIGPLSASARVGGNARVGASNVHWMAAGRRSFWSLIRNRQLSDRFRSWSEPSPFLLDAVDPDSSLGSELASLINTGSVELKFTDVHGAVRINRGLQQLYLSFYNGRNVFGNDALESDSPIISASGDEYSWHNTVANAQYDRVLTSRMLGSLKIWKSTYSLRHPFDLSPFESSQTGSVSADSVDREFNNIETLGGRGELNLSVGSRHTVSAAVDGSIVDNDFRISVDPSGEIPAISKKVYPTAKWKWTGFVQDDISLGYKTTLTTGTRVTYIPLQETAYVEPRVSLRHDQPLSAGRVLSLKFATGIYRQYLNQFDVAPYTVSAILPSFRFWIPLTADTSPPTSIHFSSETLMTFSKSLALHGEGYYKYQPHLNMINYGDRSNPGREFISSASGHATGAVVGVLVNKNGFSGQLSYIYGRSTIRIPNRFNGRSIVTPWSTPHQVRMTMDKSLGHWTLSLRGRTAIGRTWGYRQGYYDYLEPVGSSVVLEEISFSSPEDDRLPLFLQFDSGIEYAANVGLTRISFKVNALNVTARKNVIDWKLELDEATESYRKIDRYGLPFTPLVSMSVTY